MTDRNALADKFIEWVERYAKKVCPEGCLPTPGQEREITLFADVTRALRQASIDASPRARSDFATGLEQASRNEAAAFAARRSATQPAPAAAPTLGREALAEALWRHEASGTPSSHRARCEQVFADQSETTKERWFGYADAALAALTAPHQSGPDDKAEWEALEAEIGSLREKLSDALAGGLSHQSDCAVYGAPANEPKVCSCGVGGPSLRESLTRCRELFEEIRGDWTDPKAQCREGMKLLDAALPARSVAGTKEPLTISSELVLGLKATLSTMRSAKRQAIRMSIWDIDIERVEQAVATLERIAPATPSKDTTA